VAQAYLIPAPAYQFEGFNNASFPGPNTIGAIPNTDMVPENYLTFEGGLAAVLFNKRLLLDLSAFHTANDNYLLRQRRIEPPQNVVYTPRFPTKEPLVVTDAIAILTSENGGEVRAYGGELAITAELGDWFRPWGSYSLVLGSQNEKPFRTMSTLQTDYLTNQAAHQIKGGLQIRPLKGLFVVPTAVWYSRTRIRPDAGDSMNPADVALRADGLDPFFLLNISAVWESGNFQLWARVQNLLDKQYYRPGGPVSQQAAPRVPQAGILGQAGVRISY